MANVFVSIALILALATGTSAASAQEAAKDGGKARAVGDAIARVNETQQDQSKPQPLSPPQGWITFDDYPKEAILDEIGGRTEFTMKVDARGHPVDCTIIVSSRSSLLDDTACAKLLERAEFLPAQDENGRGVAGVYRGSVVWEMPQRQPMVPEGHFESTFVVDRSGEVSQCEVLVAEGAAGFAGAAETPCTDGADFIPILDENGKPVAKRVRITLRVDYEDIELPAP